MGLFRKFRSFTAEWGWEEIVPTSGSEPSGARTGALFARDGTSGKFALAGGRNASNVFVPELWTYDASAGSWTQVLSSGLPDSENSAAVGYCDGSGNLVYGGRFAGAFTSSNLREIALSTGTQTTLTDSGSSGGSGYPSFTADITNKKLWASICGTTDYYVGNASGNALLEIAQDLSANTSTRTAKTSSNTSRQQHSSPAYYPAGNALYMFAPSISGNTTWTLGTGDIIKYDLTAATGWASETGVTNNAGSAAMRAVVTAANQLVWNATESKFFLFIAGDTYSCNRVITYDPATKVIADALFSGGPPTYLLGEYDGYAAQRGNAGTVVVSGSDFYFCRVASTGVTTARIWKFRRN